MIYPYIKIKLKAIIFPTAHVSMRNKECRVALCLDSRDRDHNVQSASRTRLTPQQAAVYVANRHACRRASCLHLHYSRSHLYLLSASLNMN
jgi:hypothetical protein